ncbi:sugar phosphate nucleotidyltransferase [Gemmatimonadota bacterium]
MKALIPVAGTGTRLRPHTWTIPKALINVAGKTILGHIIDTLLDAGIDEFIFVTGHMGDRVRQWAEETYEIPMEWVIQKEMAGLGHAVLQAGNEFAGEPVFIVLGDTIFKADIGSVLERGGNSLGVVEVDDPGRFGVVVVEGEKVVRLVEKPDQPISHLAIAGLYQITDSELLLSCLERLVTGDIRTRGEYQLTDALAMMLEGGSTFRTFSLEAWYDCGVPATVLETNRALLDASGGRAKETGDKTIIIPPVHIGDEVELTGSVVGPHVTLGNGTAIRGSVVRNSIIGENCVVEGGVLDASIIGDNCVVRGRPLSLNVGDSSTIDSYEGD